MCVPATARRAVVISTQLAPSYEADYFRTRSRAHVRQCCGATTDRRPARSPTSRAGTARRTCGSGGTRSSGRSRATASAGAVASCRTGGHVRSGSCAAAHRPCSHLPSACRRFQRGPVEVYEIACLDRGLASRPAGSLARAQREAGADELPLAQMQVALRRQHLLDVRRATGLSGGVVMGGESPPSRGFLNEADTCTRVRLSALIQIIASRTISMSASVVRGLTSASRPRASPSWVVGSTNAVPDSRRPAAQRA